MSATVIQFRPQIEKEPTLREMADVNKVLRDDELSWVCRCGHPLFFVTRERGIVCQACGDVQNWNNDK